MKRIDYGTIKKFDNDLKKLSKKFNSLKEDLETVKRYSLNLFHLKEVDNNGIFEIKGIGNTEEIKFFKVKKFQCKSLKGRGAKSGIRLIYSYFPKEQKVILLEIYFKADKENEDRDRIKELLKNK